MPLLRSVSLALALTLVLGGIAWLSPAPARVTDRATYEAVASRVVVPDCDDLHCFRVLVPWVLGVLPGPSLVKWKTFAVAANAAGAAAVFILCLAWGISRRAAWLAASLSAFGFGTLYTLHDSFTPDPLMYLVGPLLMILVARQRVALAGLVGAVAVTAKEFAAAPLYIAAGGAWWHRRPAEAARTLAAANACLLVWLTLHLTLMIGFNYSYGDNPSPRLLSGGYLVPWARELGAAGVATALLNEFGAIWILAPVGLLLAPRALRRTAVAALPVAAVFAYVQQPDRALWNFHFLASPLAALVLARAPSAVAWSVVAAFAVANLRVGAQLPRVPAARFALAASALLSLAAVAAAWRSRAHPASVAPRLAHG